MLPFEITGWFCPDPACLCQQRKHGYLAEWTRLVRATRTCGDASCRCHAGGNDYCCQRCRRLDKDAIHQAALVALRLDGVVSPDADFYREIAEVGKSVRALQDSMKTIAASLGDFAKTAGTSADQLGLAFDRRRRSRERGVPGGLPFSGGEP